MSRLYAPPTLSLSIYRYLYIEIRNMKNTVLVTWMQYILYFKIHSYTLASRSIHSIDHFSYNHTT
jgi:hypothetical protein